MHVLPWKQLPCWITIVDLHFRTPTGPVHHSEQGVCFPFYISILLHFPGTWCKLIYYNFITQLINYYFLIRKVSSVHFMENRFYFIQNILIMLSPTPIPSRSLHLSSQIHTLFISCLLENMCLKQENNKAKSKKSKP